jgi:chitin disaccharide deacetylase
MRRLIVNADDFGYTRGVNWGIIRGFRDGIITSATIMANGAAFEDAIRYAKENPTLGVGCHLVLVGGACVEAADAIPTLADHDGRLPRSLAVLTGKLVARAVRLEDIARELRAQISKVAQAGIKPTHLDSHKHTHLHPRIMEQVIRVGEEFGVRRIRKPFEDPAVLLRFAFQDGWGSWMRPVTMLVARTAAPQFEKLARDHGVSMPGHFWGMAATGHLSRDVIMSMIGSMPEGVNELMCHPGEYDDELERSRTRLKKARQDELEVLVDPSVRSAIQQRGIELVDYRGLD